MSLKQIVLPALVLVLVTANAQAQKKVDCDYYLSWITENQLTTQFEFAVKLEDLNQNEREEMQNNRADGILNIPTQCKEKWQSENTVINEPVQSKLNQKILDLPLQARTDRRLPQYEINKKTPAPIGKNKIISVNAKTKKTTKTSIAKMPRLELFVRAASTNSQTLSRSNIRPKAILQAYRDILPVSSYSCGSYYITMTEEQKQKHHQCLYKRGKQLQGKFDEAIVKTEGKILSFYTLASGVNLNERDVLILYHFHRSLRAGGENPQQIEANMLGYLRSIKNQLTTDEKLTLAQMWGAQFSDDYDYSRDDKGPSANGGVRLGELLQSAQHNNYVGYGVVDYFSKARSDAAMMAGVCRDIASGGGQILQALGFENTFLISIANIGGSYHVSILAQDPNYPQIIYGLDYARRRTIAGGNSDNILNDLRDISMNYRVFKPAGAMVDNIQSTLGKVLSEATTFAPLDPMARLAPVMTAAKLKVIKGLSIHAGYAQDHKGANYYYGGASYDWKSGKVGVTYARQKRKSMKHDAYEDGYDNSTDLDIIFAQVEQRVKSKDFAITETIRARIEGLIGAMVMGGYARGGKDDGHSSVQADLYTQFGIRLDQVGKKFKGTYKLGAQISPGISDVRDNYLWQVPIPVVNHLYLSADGRLKLSKTEAGRVYLIATTIVLVDALGIRGRIQGGVQVGKIKIMARFEGRLTDSTMNIQDGSERRAGLSVEWDISKHLGIVIDATSAFGDDYAYSINPIEITGSARLML